MVDFDAFDELAEDEPSLGNDLRTVESAVASIVTADERWQPGETLQLAPGLAWRFHLMRDEPKAVLHVHLADVLRSHVLDRLRAASGTGYQTHVAMPLGALYESDVQVVLAEIDGFVHVIDGAKVHPGEHHLDALTNNRVAVSPEARTTIARAAWARRADGTSQHKGRFFEALLSFLFEQVAEFTVIERNYRGDSDEVDIWLQIGSWSERCWQENGVPFILVEGKNRAEHAGAPFVVHIKGQLREKRRRTRIGILCSTSTFSSDAVTEVIKLAESEYSVALLGPAELEAWIDSDTPSDYLEAQIRRAMLR